MFKYWETYTVYCYHCYDEDELQKIANDYKKYIENSKLYHGIEIKEDYDSFSDYVLENLSLSDDICKFDYDFNDGNIEEFYNEIKKYL